jgi:iron uptake system component EfeO
MMIAPIRRGVVSAAICTALAVPLLSACTENQAPQAADSANPRAVTVQATDTECKLSATTAPSGNLTFSVFNGGSKVTEFYLYGADGRKIIGEVEDISPGVSRDLVIEATPGQYVTACKPGMVGEGIRAPFTVS